MPSHLNDESLIEVARQAVSIEIDGLRAQLPRLGPDFARACRICLDCRGRVVVTGMGKSGHIAGKIAATLASTGTPAFFVHPGEASHGDIGMITRDDVLLVLSNSGETDEILTILETAGASFILVNADGVMPIFANGPQTQRMMFAMA